MLASGQKILPEKTLIIFDEVQDCPNVINSMKYFCENAPQYHIACAGSLLGIALAKPSSFPVGKVNFMQIDPMTFEEFLLANGDDNLLAFLQSWDTIEPIPNAFFNPLYEKLKMYYVTGGMPESVLMWTEARDVSAMQEALAGIIGAYERDFAKHPNISEFPKISMIWKSIPSQLARENKKFIYKVVKEGARAREYENALQWLVDARLVHKIYRSLAPGLPVAAYDNLSAFKIYLVDVGLLRRLAQLAPTAFGEGNRLFTEFKGALTENFVLQTLITQFEVVPRYWTQSNPPLHHFRQIISPHPLHDCFHLPSPTCTFTLSVACTFVTDSRRTIVQARIPARIPFVPTDIHPPQKVRPIPVSLPFPCLPSRNFGSNLKYCGRSHIPVLSLSEAALLP